MTTHLSTAPRQRLVAFFVLAFVFTWAWWIPAGLIEQGIVATGIPTMVLLITGGLGPMAAALVCSSSALGGRGLRLFLHNAFRWRASRRSYLLATAPIAVLVLGTIPVQVAIGAEWDGAGLMRGMSALVPMFVFTFVLGGGIDEEFGWRAFALPGLQASLPPWSANLILGVVWSLWHLPLWWNPAVAQYDSNYPMYIVSTTGFSFVLGWLYNSSQGNTMVAVVAHTVSNVSYGLQAAALDPVFQWIDVVVMGSAGLAIVLFTRGKIGLRPTQPAHGEIRATGGADRHV
ncbi:type II CAAX endopeptidase family protein [Nocardia ninae]|uniref:CPBP family intramembrane metalloprotease n=1 Tax=Nocardia ninae NBRC 108245 TaxID=1210091 RepID=A0A511M5N3_9NOCA|nr:type II CAAX endopeptidase family protein [Nocardia ninae]GEM35942.1 CPBP family intramembrane metalloprotease [Nocardia ninae NBRC 108245]